MSNNKTKCEPHYVTLYNNIDGSYLRSADDDKDRPVNQNEMLAYLKLLESTIPLTSGYHVSVEDKVDVLMVIDDMKKLNIEDPTDKPIIREKFDYLMGKAKAIDEREQVVMEFRRERGY